MRNVMVVLPATLIAAVMVFAGLWAWNAAADWVLDFNVSRPEVAVWAVRSAAVGAIAAAQVVLLALVGARLYGRGKVDSAMAFTAGAVCAVACVSAVAFGLAGR
jgi:hypothetical protein